MKPYSKVTPEGTRDILFEECRAQRRAQERLTRVFTARGYHEVITPGLEYFDVFDLPGAAIPQQEMYKTTDNHGRLLVFRPDSTLPIARMAASRLQNQQRPLRLYYNQSVYRNSPDLSGRSDEPAQMGIELLGASGLRADLEAISTAVAAVSACVSDFRLEIGHARLFGALMDRLPVTSERREAIRATIEAKNYAALSELLDPLGNSEAVEAIRNLPRLFGGEEALEAAEAYCRDEETAGVLRYLRKLYASLSRLGLGEKLMVDLGLVQRNDYYTGVVFSSYVQEHGEAVLLGGRYDSLCEKFDSPMPAVGFAADVEALAVLMSPEEREALPVTVIHGEDGYEMEAQKLLSQLTAEGKNCESSVFETREEARAYAAAIGAAALISVGKETKEVTLP